MPAHTIDWEAVHRRLAVVAAAMSGGFDPGPQESRRILEARARAAARPPVRLDAAERIEILTFSLEIGRAHV